MKCKAPKRTLVEQVSKAGVSPPADFFRPSEARLRSPQQVLGNHELNDAVQIDADFPSCQEDKLEA